MLNHRDLAYALGLTLTSPVWAFSLLRTGKWRTDWRGRFGYAPPRSADGRATVLFCAVSVGEVSLLRGLIDELREREPQLRLVIATTTNTGYARASALYGERHEVVRYPFDFSWMVSRFLDRVKPSVVATVELEVWPNFVDACAAREVPVCVVNGRLSERSFRGYRRIRRWIGSSFSKLSAVAAQTDAYAARFEAMGARDVRVLDTMKWDSAAVQGEVSGASDLAAELGIDRDRPVVVAGSTGPGEDKLLVEALAGWPNGAQLVIAPRKPEWFDQVMAVCPEAVRLTSVRNLVASGAPRPRALGEGPRRVFLIDTIGELRKAYALADVAVVGRSFFDLHGSDVMEPAALGKAVVIGPRYEDFRESVEALRDAGGLMVRAEVGSAVAELLADWAKAARMGKAARATVAARRGSTRRHAEMILDMLASVHGSA